MRNSLMLISIATSLTASVASARAQQTSPASAPTSAPVVSSQPVVSGDSLVYEVYDVVGKVLVAPIGMDPLKNADAWRAVARGESIGAGMQLRTTARSSIKLIARPADPPTVILIESITRLAIDDLAVREGRAVSRISLGYGAIRAGVAEGQVRSDMEIATPQAVLSKKGTDIFRIEYMNGRFNVSLSEQGRGLLQAIQLQFSNRGDIVGFKARFITPGQQVTQRMAQAIESMTWDRDINVNDMFGLIGNDRLFTLLNDRGFGFLLPFNTTTANIFGGATPTNRGQDTGSMNGGPFSYGSSQGVRPISDGDFGIGQGAIPNVFGSLRSRTTMRTQRAESPTAANSFKALMRQKSRPRFNFGRHR